MKESVFSRSCVYCVVVLLKWLRGCGGSFLVKLKN